MNFEPLGDQAVMAYAPNEQAALHFARRVRQAGLSWVIDVVQAYASVAVFYDLSQLEYSQARTELSSVADRVSDENFIGPIRRHVIPCCYEMALDFERVTNHTGARADDIVRLHTGAIYTVFAIGFCPGFPYLGYLADEIAGVPRLPSPRLRVEAGSVGLTGGQTGIYTLPRPGGWNIVGRTPLELVNVEENYFPMRTGDEVRFEPIDRKQFEKLRGQRLSLAD